MKTRRKIRHGREIAHRCFHCRSPLVPRKNRLQPEEEFVVESKIGRSRRLESHAGEPLVLIFMRRRASRQPSPSPTSRRASPRKKGTRALRHYHDTHVHTRVACAYLHARLQRRVHRRLLPRGMTQRHLRSSRRVGEGGGCRRSARAAADRRRSRGWKRGSVVLRRTPAPWSRDPCGVSRSLLGARAFPLRYAPQQSLGVRRERNADEIAASFVSLASHSGIAFVPRPLDLGIGSRASQPSARSYRACVSALRDRRRRSTLWTRQRGSLDRGARLGSTRVAGREGRKQGEGGQRERERERGGRGRREKRDRATEFRAAVTMRVIDRARLRDRPEMWYRK